MALLEGQYPKLAITLNSGSAVLSGGTAGALGQTTGNQFTIYTPGSFGGRVYSVMASSPVVSAFFLYIQSSGGTNQTLGIVNVPVNSGNSSAIKNIDALNNVQVLGLPVDNTGKLYIPLRAGDTLKASWQTLASNAIYVTALGLDYVS